MYEILLSEVVFRFSRSQGPGGQNVNKVETKVELRFDIWKSSFLTIEQKDIISNKFSNKINSDGILVIYCDSSRSQSKNRETVSQKFLEIIENALKPAKKRKRTKPTKSSVEKRLTKKKIVSEKKKNRNTIE